MDDQRALALAYLQRNPLKHITMLKLLHTYGEAISCAYCEREDAAGALISFPPAVFPYDAQTYPQAERIVLLSTGGPPAAEALLDTLPQGTALVFKLVDPADKAVVARRFALRRTLGFASYTSAAGQAWPTVEGVLASEELDPQLAELFVAQGHDRAELAAWFARGSLTFAIYEDGHPLAACYIFPNFGAIWEIAGVYTAPEARRRGYGARVVSAALHALAARGLTPRYQVYEENQPSIALAESIGLRHFVTIEHFVTR
jgi:GNAT superfamily N-acetyltransferase